MKSGSLEVVADPTVSDSTNKVLKYVAYTDENNVFELNLPRFGDGETVTVTYRMYVNSITVGPSKTDLIVALTCNDNIAYNSRIAMIKDSGKTWFGDQTSSSDRKLYGSANLINAWNDIKIVYAPSNTENTIQLYLNGKLLNAGNRHTGSTPQAYIDGFKVMCSNALVAEVYFDDITVTKG